MKRKPIKPEVGQTVRVTTRYHNLYAFGTDKWVVNTHIGEVLPGERWFTPDQFKLSSNTTRMAFRVIDMRHVVTVDLSPVSTDSNTVGHRPKAFIVDRGTSDMNAKVKTMTWGDRLALLQHYSPSDAVACSALGVTPDELATAREMQSSGSFTPTDNLDVAAYSELFPTEETAKPGVVTVTAITAPEKPSGPTSISSAKPAETASKPIKAPKKRGRKGSNINTAFAAIPTTPTPAEPFASTHKVSIAVLRQGKRFDPTPDLGVVKVKLQKPEDGDAKVLMIWREVATA